MSSWTLGQRLPWTQLWRQVLFLRWELPRPVFSALADWLPTGLDLDLYCGRAYLSAVAFRLEQVRPTALGGWLGRRLAQGPWANLPS